MSRAWAIWNGILRNDCAYYHSLDRRLSILQTSFIVEGDIVLQLSIALKSLHLQCIASNQKCETGMMHCTVVRLYEGRVEFVRSRLKEQWSYEMSTRFEGGRPIAIVVVNDRKLLDGVHCIHVSCARPVSDVYVWETQQRAVESVVILKLRCGDSA